MVLLEIIMSKHKVDWPLLFISIGLILLGLLALSWWDPKKKMKDDPGAYNLRQILAFITFTGVGSYELVRFVASLFIGHDPNW